MNKQGSIFIKYALKPHRSIRKHLWLLSLSTWLAFSVSAKGADNTAIIELGQVTKQNIAPTQWFPGKVIALNESDLASEVTGRINWIIDEGKQVSVGDVVIKLDDTRLQIQLKEHLANLERERANQKYLARQVQRLQKLRGTNVASQEILDETEMKLAVAIEDVKAAESKVTLTRYEITESQIKAPFSGVVVKKLSNLGEFANAGEPILRLVDTQRVAVSVSTPIALASNLSEGMNILSDYKGTQFVLPISGLIPVANSRSQTFEVRLDGKSANLMIGSAVNVGIPRKKEQEVLAVQRDSLILRDKEIYIFTVDQEMKAHKVPVIIGDGYGDLVEVRGNVKAGEKVVIKGGETLRDGQSVKVKEVG